MRREKYDETRRRGKRKCEPLTRMLPPSETPSGLGAGTHHPLSPLPSGMISIPSSRRTKISNPSTAVADPSSDGGDWKRRVLETQTRRPTSELRSQDTLSHALTSIRSLDELQLGYQPSRPSTLPTSSLSLALPRDPRLFLWEAEDSGEVEGIPSYRTCVEIGSSLGRWGS